MAERSCVICIIADICRCRQLHTQDDVQSCMHSGFRERPVPRLVMLRSPCGVLLHGVRHLPVDVYIRALDEGQGLQRVLTRGARRGEASVPRCPAIPHRTHYDTCRDCPMSCESVRAREAGSTMSAWRRKEGASIVSRSSMGAGHSLSSPTSGSSITAHLDDDVGADVVGNEGLDVRHARVVVRGEEDEL